MAALFEGLIRRELKKRVDDVLAAGEQWKKTAKELKEAIEKLTAAIKQGEPHLSPIASALVAATRRHSKNTAKLEKRFGSYEKTLSKLAAKL